MTEEIETELSRPNRRVRCYIAQPLESVMPYSVENLKRECVKLLEHITFFHAPGYSDLELLVEYDPLSIVEVSPKNASCITQLSLNRGSSPIGKKEVPDGLADVTCVGGADYIELAIGSTEYRVFSKPEPKITPGLPFIDAEIPKSYHIEYTVKGGAWGLKDSPAEQLKEVDKAFLTLQEHAELYYPVKRTNNLYPFVKLTHNGVENGITYVELEYLQRCGHGFFLDGHSCVSLDMAFKQKFSSTKDRAVVLRIRGGTHNGMRASICIGTVAYELIMKNHSTKKAPNNK